MFYGKLKARSPIKIISHIRHLFPNDELKSTFVITTAHVNTHCKPQTTANYYTHKSSANSEQSCATMETWVLHVLVFYPNV